MAMCVDPTKAEASGLSKSALASMGIGVSNIDDAERARRRALLKRIMEDVIPAKDLGDTPLLPGLGFHEGFTVEEQSAIVVPEDLLKRVAEKILRGCEYKLNHESYIKPPYQLNVYFAHDTDVADSEIFKLLKTSSLGPGLEIGRGESPDDGHEHIIFYKLLVWGTVPIYGIIDKSITTVARLND
jgi:hypothetical protein